MVNNYTADGSATAVEATGSTDASLHNPRQAVGVVGQPAGGTDPATSQPRAPLEATAPTNGGGVAIIDPNVPRTPVPQGPTKTQHSQATGHGAPARR
jgi:hypothetical protein